MSPSFDIFRAVIMVVGIFEAEYQAHLIHRTYKEQSLVMSFAIVSAYKSIPFAKARDCGLSSSDRCTTESRPSTQSSFGGLDRGYHRLKHAFIIQGSECCSFTPAHLLEHCSTSVLYPNFRSCRTYHLPVSI